MSCVDLLNHDLLHTHPLPRNHSYSHLSTPTHILRRRADLGLKYSSCGNTKPRRGSVTAALASPLARSSRGKKTFAEKAEMMVMVRLYALR
jgi:hypothetical protein